MKLDFGFQNGVHYLKEKFSINIVITIKESDTDFFFFFLLWIEAQILTLALHEIAGEEDLNSDSIGEYAVSSHSWCKRPRLLCRTLNFQERTVVKCCINYLFNEAAYFSFPHSLFQMNHVLDEAVCVDCRGTGQAHSCTSDAVKCSFLFYMKYKLSLKELNPHTHHLVGKIAVVLFLMSQMP